MYNAHGARNITNEKLSTISSINRGGQNVNLLGIVLHKSSIKRVENKDCQQPCRGVFSFVLRDNLHSWVNLNYWGSYKSAGELSASFSIGDVILVLQGQTKVINEGSYEERYMFHTPSRFTILLNENRSRILPYSCNNKVQIKKLQTELLCSPGYHISLKQVIQYIYKNNAPVGNTKIQNTLNFGQQAIKHQPQFFTFFAAVMEVGEMKSVVVKRSPLKSTIPELMSPGLNISADEGKSSQVLLHKCEITLIDETCGHFPMILWNEDLIMYALRFWKSKVTVLSIVNCPVRYDSFRRGVVAVPNDRTGIITSPACEEAIRLAQYAKYSAWSPITGAPDISDAMGQHFSQPLPLTFGRVPPEIEHVSLSGIHTVRTIEDILGGKVNSGFGIVFAMLTKLPLDSEDVIRHVRLSCSNCQRRMHACLNDGDGSTTEVSSSFTCLTPDCPHSGQRFDPLDLEHVNVEYSIFLNLSDHTGTYSRCTFTNSAAEAVFEMPAKDFLQLSLQRRTQLKWKLLLNRFKVYFWMRQPGFDQPNPYLNVLACERPNPFEVYSSLGAVTSVIN